MRLIADFVLAKVVLPPLFSHQNVGDIIAHPITKVKTNSQQGIPSDSVVLARTMRGWLCVFVVQVPQGGWPKALGERRILTD